VSRALIVIRSLALCERRSVSNKAATLWLLFNIWARLGDRVHEEIFPELVGSPAGWVLEEMKAHYARYRAK
jgi:hypothetical protein